MSADQIVEDLADRIARGEYPPGTQLPSYRQLSNLYDVSFATIATVIVRLKDRSLVVGVRGRGVFVAESVQPPPGPKPKRSGLNDPFAT
jgi:DNA-binding GntR family transcriptional regulator